MLNNVKFSKVFFKNIYKRKIVVVLKVVRGMRKFIEILVLLVLVMTFGLQAEAKTYTNTRLRIAIDLPDYFVERNNYGGMYDFIADGGDDYGTENLLRGREGMDISISSQSCEYQNVSIEFLQQQIQQYIAAARNFGINTNYTIVSIPPGHPVILGLNRNAQDKVNVSVIAYLHGNKIDICMSGTMNNVDKITAIMDSLRCIAH